MEYSTSFDSTGSTTAIAGGVLLAYWIFVLVLTVFYVVCMWKIFTKAGKPGWASLIPIYNIIVMLEIIGRPIWWILLMLIPFVNFIILIIIMLDLAASYGKSTLFGILGLLLFPIIGYPMLAFGSAKYVGPTTFDKASTPPAAPTPPAAV